MVRKEKVIPMKTAKEITKKMVSIAGIDRYSTAGAFSTHDPSNFVIYRFSQSLKPGLLLVNFLAPHCNKNCNKTLQH